MVEERFEMTEETEKYCEYNGEKFVCERVFEHDYSFSDTASKDIKTVMIPPEKFLTKTYKEVMDRKIRQGKPEWQSYDDYINKVIIKENVEGIKEKIENKECCLPIPFLTFNEEGEPTGHEGRHTAKATQELGFKEIPVTIEKPKGIEPRNFTFNKIYKEQYG